MSLLTPNSSSPDQCRRCKSTSPATNHKASRVLPCAVVAENTAYQIAARSRHPGEVNVSLCDGSVRFVSETISHAIWEAALSGNGGESLQLP